MIGGRPRADANPVPAAAASTAPPRVAGPRRICGAGWLVPGLVAFTVLRLPSFIEPHWYTDEAGYATVARSLLQGRALYSDTWNNKPPLQLWTVALPVRLFGASEAGLHALTFVFGLATLAAVALAGHRLLGPRRAGVALLGAALLLGSPLLDAELAIPESLLIAPASWAGALVLTRLAPGRRAPSGWAAGLRARWWPAGAGVLAAAAVAYQQTALADAAAFGLVIAVSPRARLRELALYAGAALVATAAWLIPFMALAGPGTVAFALAGFYVSYSAAVLPTSRSGLVAHATLLGLSVGLLVIGASLNRRSDRMWWALCVWAGAALLVAAAAQQPYAHFLTPAVAPAALTVAGLRRPRGDRRAASMRALRAAPLLAGVVVAAAMARIAGVDWVPGAAAAGGNGYRNLDGYYVGALGAALGRQQLTTWQDWFDGRVAGDAEVAAWLRANGLSGRSAVVWSSDAWPYLLADLPVLLRTPPIYNNFVLLGSNGQVSARVASLEPDVILVADDAAVLWPEIHPVLVRSYRAVHAAPGQTVWLRRDLGVPGGRVLAFTGP